jgi:hypothetical protein
MRCSFACKSLAGANKFEIATQLLGLTGAPGLALKRLFQCNGVACASNHKAATALLPLKVSQDQATCSISGFDVVIWPFYIMNVISYSESISGIWGKLGCEGSDLDLASPMFVVIDRGNKPSVHNCTVVVFADDIIPLRRFFGLLSVNAARPLPQFCC